MISMFFVMLCRETVLQYSIEAMKLQRRLLGLISESLGLEPNSLEDGLGEPNQSIMVNYYPACPQPDLALGLQVRELFLQHIL